MHRIPSCFQKQTYIIVLLVIALGACFYAFFAYQKGRSVYTQFVGSGSCSKRKKILIFTSCGGRGHISATEALQEYLDDTYEVKPVYVIRDVLKELDFIYTLTGGTYHSEELYNHFLTRKQVGMVRPMVYAGKLFFVMQQHAVERLLAAYIEAEKPDMIISVIPMINGATERITSEMGIPFWVIPTDFDASLFTFQLHKPQSGSFFMNCALPDELVATTLRSARLEASQCTYIGMPVREQFLKSYDRNLIKAHYDIPLTKPVIMVMMGGRGMCSMRHLADMLLKLEHPVHILFCIGNQTNIKEYLEMADLPPQVSISIISFTPHIAEFMAISDLFITKSGGQSVSEALYMGLPMIIDATDQALDWEQLNRTLVHKRGYGILIRRYNALRSLVHELLEDPAQLAQWKNHIQKLNLPNPRESVRALVTKLLEK